MQQHTSRQDIAGENTQSCPDGKYWVRPHKRRRVSKNGKTYTFFVLTLYGEARGENAASRQAHKCVIISVGRHNIAIKKSFLICQMFLIFTSLNWINNCFAQASQNASAFEIIQKDMHAKKHCGVEYNFSKTAAIVGAACGRAHYINFHKKETYTIAEQYRGFSVKWLDDNTVTLEAGCGTGCMVAYIFIAPAIVVYCPVHEYRIDFLDPHEPPDYYHNRPLLVDPKRRIYVCYDENNTIQVYPFPRHASIRPPKGYFTEKASMVKGKLVVQYANRQGHKQQIAY